MGIRFPDRKKCYLISADKFCKRVQQTEISFEEASVNRRSIMKDSWLGSDNRSARISTDEL